MSHQTTTVTTLQVVESQDGEEREDAEVLPVFAVAAHGSSTEHVLTVRSQPRIEPIQDRGGVTWSDDVVDNENMGKKKSKKCCIYHKPRTFGEWSDSEDSDHECDHCSH